MSELKHTPGPWRLVREERGRLLLKPETPDGLGAQIAQLFNYQMPAEANVANARLIAAAPDLLEFVLQEEQLRVRVAHCDFCLDADTGLCGGEEGNPHNHSAEMRSLERERAAVIVKATRQEAQP